MSVALTGVDAGVGALAALLGEDQGRAIVTTAPSNAARVLAMAEQHDVPAMTIGTVGDPDGSFAVDLGELTVTRDIGAMRSTYLDAIPRRMSAPVTSGETG